MARDSNGNFTRVHDWTDDALNGIKILASRADEEDDGFATALTNSLDRSSGGGGNILRNIDLTTHKITSVADGSVLTDAINYGQVQNGEILYLGTTTGSSNVYELAPSPSINSYRTGMAFRLKFNVENDNDEDEDTPTIDISELGVKDIKKYNITTGDKVDLKASDLLTGIFYNAIYDGTDIVILNTAKVDSLVIDKVLNYQDNAQDIVSGAITYEGVHTILTPEDDEDDELNTINGGNKGDICILTNFSENDASVRVIHNAESIDLGTQKDVLIASELEKLTLICYSPGKWFQLSRTIFYDFETDVGYYHLPNDIFVQYGYASGTYKTFPISFDGVQSVVAQRSDGNGGIITAISSVSNTGFSISSKDFTGNIQTPVFSWIAIGHKAQ